MGPRLPYSRFFYGETSDIGRLVGGSMMNLLLSLLIWFENIKLSRAAKHGSPVWLPRQYAAAGLSHKAEMDSGF